MKNVLIKGIILAATISNVAPALGASEGPILIELATCYGKDLDGVQDYSFSIIEVSKGGLLGNGLYIDMRSDDNWNNTSLFKVRAGDESVKIFVGRIKDYARQIRDGNPEAVLDFSDIRFSAVGVDLGTTSDLRGEVALVFRSGGSSLDHQFAIGDSFFRSNPYSLGKNKSLKIQGCY